MRPLTFMTDDDLADVAPGTLIVDVSCDEGMGFSWARPTTFAEPTFVVGDNVLYYAVDHSPSYLWNSATWEISEALLPFLRTRHGGPRRLGREPHHPPGHRDPRRGDPESRDPVVPGPRTGAPAPASGDLNSTSGAPPSETVGDRPIAAIGSQPAAGLPSRRPPTGACGDRVRSSSALQLSPERVDLSRVSGNPRSQDKERLMNVSGVSSNPYVHVPPPAQKQGAAATTAAIQPRTSRVDADGDHDGDTASSDRLDVRG